MLTWWFQNCKATMHPLTGVSVVRPGSTFISDVKWYNLQLTWPLPTVYIYCVIAGASVGLFHELNVVLIPEPLSYVPGPKVERELSVQQSKILQREAKKCYLTSFFGNVYNRLGFKIAPSTVILLHFSTKCKCFWKSFQMVGAGDFNPRLE